MMSFSPPGAIVQFIYRDTSGCSHVRLRWNSQYLAGVAEAAGITPLLLPNPILDGGWLSGTRAIIWQRPISDQDIAILEKLKAAQPQFHYKLIAEFDDLTWISHGEGIPEYNQASLNSKLEDLHKQMPKLLPLLDEVIVSTEWLKKSLKDTFGFEKVRVVKNVIPRFLWSNDRKPDITEDIKVPTILYSGAPQHYRNPIPPCPQFPNGVVPLRGDWSQDWIDFIVKNVKAGKINFICMGALPWFFEEIKDMITFVPWVDCNSFPRTVMSIKPDFAIAPLTENEFNRCKSDLRFIESCAIGAVFLGSDWPNSPYEDIHPDCRCPKDITKEQLQEKFDNLCKKDNYNKVRNWQYSYLNDKNRWLESNGHTNNLLSAMDNSQVMTPLI